MSFKAFPSELDPILPVVEFDVYDALEREAIRRQGDFVPRLEQEIAARDQERAVTIGSACASMALSRQKGLWQPRETPDAVQDQLVVAYAALMRAQQHNERRAEAQGWPVFGGLPLMPPSTSSGESHLLTDITDYFIGEATLDSKLMKETQALIDSRGNDCMARLVEGGIRYPTDPDEYVAGRAGCLAMWGVLNTYAYNMTGV